MGKSLSGKELGKGIGQRKDGLYYSRTVLPNGSRIEKCFRSLTDALNWRKKSVVDKNQNGIKAEPTVDEWFEYWKNNIINDLAPNTIRNYCERYNKNVKSIIGDMRISDVKPMHCKEILNSMDKDYAGSTIRQTYIMLGSMLKSAKNNDLIDKHPLDAVRFSKPVKPDNDIRFLSKDEEQKFLDEAKKTNNYYQYRLLLDTGMRTGELIGLTWDCVDFDSGTITINKTLEYRHSQGKWRAGPPKTKSSYRKIPLTKTADDILKKVLSEYEFCRHENKKYESLPYVDKLTGRTKTLDMHDLVFLNPKNGYPIKNSSYDTNLYKICSRIGIETISMHSLRHTFATKAIERGMQPKVLQKILGHSSIKTTMDRYVHVNDSYLYLSVKEFEKYDE